MRLPFVMSLCVSLLYTEHAFSVQTSKNKRSNSDIPEYVEAEVASNTPADLKKSLLDLQQRRRKVYDSAVKYMPEAGKDVKLTERARIVAGQPNSINSTSGVRIFGSKKAKTDALSESTNRLSELKARIREAATNPTLVTPFDRQIAIGDIGVVKDRMAVRQVINENAIIADAWIGEKNELIWISGINATKLTDGAAVSFSFPVRVIGTKSYSNALGARRTVFELAPVDIDKFILNTTKVATDSVENERNPKSE